MRERDNQRSKLYAAEREALWAIATRIETVPEIATWINRQSKRATLVRRFGYAVDVSDFQIADGRGRRIACSYVGANKIALPLWARSDIIALHEWAHTIHDRLTRDAHRLNASIIARHGERTKELAGGAAHGWQYAAIYLDLVRFCISDEAAEAFKIAMRKHHVRWTPKRTRILSPEERAAIGARLSVYRAPKPEPDIFNSYGYDPIGPEAGAGFCDTDELARIAVEGA